jgi:hypothetical protein
LREFGVEGFFGDVGGAFEVELVAVGVGDDGGPHGIADEGFARFEAPGRVFKNHLKLRVWIVSKLVMRYLLHLVVVFEEIACTTRSQHGPP